MKRLAFVALAATLIIAQPAQAKGKPIRCKSNQIAAGVCVKYSWSEARAGGGIVRFYAWVLKSSI